MALYSLQHLSSFHYLSCHYCFSPVAATTKLLDSRPRSGCIASTTTTGRHSTRLCQWEDYDSVNGGNAKGCQILLIDAEKGDAAMERNEIHRW